MEVHVMGIVLTVSKWRCLSGLARLILVSLALLGAPKSASAASASYRCSDGTAVQAVFHGLGQAGSVQLTFAGRARPMTLAQAPSADGGRYTNGDAEFWIKGASARLTRQGVEIECQTASGS
jgi:membrane-bound inhibitor of C-type lysozyme